MGNIFEREPARVAGIITNFLTVMLLLLAAFGLEISEDQRNAILGSIIPGVAFIQLMFEMTRSQVVATSKAAPLIQTALQESPEKVTPEMVAALQNYDLQGARQIKATAQQVEERVEDTDPWISELPGQPGAR